MVPTLATIEEKCDALVSLTAASSDSGFYRKYWGSAKTFAALPSVSRLDFIKTPLSKRRYKKDEEALVKVVHTERGSFLSEWSMSDIQKEEYGVHSARPMVYLSDPYDALEKSLWCYEHRMVPLIGEKNSAVAISAARKYRIDSLITDISSLHALLPYLESGTEKLLSISILGTSFVSEEVMPFGRYAKRVRLVLALPETGAFAEAELSESPIFMPLPECIVECRESLVLTKIAPLTTPIIRYNSGILAKEMRREGMQCSAFALL